MKQILFLLALFFLVIPEKAHAYLDPNTGSYLLQIMAAGLFGGLYAVSHWWKKIKEFVLKFTSRKEKNHSEKKPLPKE